MSDRSTTITIGGSEYELILTTRATKEISARYGGLDRLGDKLMNSESFEMTLTEVIWLLMVLANQSVMIHNLRNPSDKRPLLTEDELELLTSPLEIADYKDAITEAMYRGTMRTVESVSTPKNTTAG